MLTYSGGYATVNLSGDYTISCTTFDGGNSAVTLELDANLIRRPGRYVIVKSTNAITNPPTSITAVFVGTTSLKVRKTARESVTYSSGTFDCITVTIG